MKNLALALAATAALGGQAIAADMPMKARPAPIAVVAPVNWTGCYIAGGGGGGWQVNDNYQYAVPGNQFAFPAGPVTVNKTDGLHGWFGTVQGGCDWQAGNFVIGAFADYDFSDINGDHLGLNLNNIGRQKQDWAWAVGGRVGYLVLPQLLTYVSAGWTQAHWNGVAYGTAAFPGGPPAFTTAAYDRNGWFIGAGDEVALTNWAPGLFWKTEYRYAEYDRGDTQYFNFPANTPTGVFSSERFKSHTVRTELVWKFNWGSPVVAKY